MNENEIKRAIADFAQRIAERFRDYPDLEIYDDPADMPFCSEDLFVVFQNEAKRIHDELKKRREVKGNG